MVFVQSKVVGALFMWCVKNTPVCAQAAQHNGEGRGGVPGTTMSPKDTTFSYAA